MTQLNHTITCSQGLQSVHHMLIYRKLKQYSEPLQLLQYKSSWRTLLLIAQMPLAYYSDCVCILSHALDCCEILITRHCCVQTSLKTLQGVINQGLRLFSVDNAYSVLCLRWPLLLQKDKTKEEKWNCSFLLFTISQTSHLICCSLTYSKCA